MGIGWGLKKIVEINKTRTFSRSDAQEILPLLTRITNEASQVVARLITQLNGQADRYGKASELIEQEINQIVTRWQVKIEKLGAIPKGMWLVDFDNGTGYFCWKYPEPDILFHHGYQDGLTGRIMINENDQNPLI